MRIGHRGTSAQCPAKGTHRTPRIAHGPGRGKRRHYRRIGVVSIVRNQEMEGTEVIVTAGVSWIAIVENSIHGRQRLSNDRCGSAA